MSLAKKKLTLKITKADGKTTYGKAIIQIKKSKGIKIKKKIFTSGNKKIAAVTKKDGKVTAKKDGSVNIKSKITYVKNSKTKTKTLTCKVTVKTVNKKVSQTASPEAVTTPSGQVSENTPAPVAVQSPAVVPAATSSVTVPENSSAPTATENPAVVPADNPAVTESPAVATSDVPDVPLPADDNAGLYNESNELEKSWTALVADGDIKVTDGNIITNCSSELNGKLVIANRVTSIGNNAFENCTSLTSITIPDSVTNIGREAFEGCSEDLVIHTPEGSTAESYAKSNGIKYDNIIS